MNLPSFLSVPTGLWLAAATIPPLLALYFLRLRRRTQPIATTLLWQRSVEDLRANAPFQRLRPSVLLFLQLLALTLIVLAIMQPQIQGGGRPDQRTILLIDNSASMRATDSETDSTRLDEAKRRASELVEQLYGGGFFSRASAETMVVAFNDRGEIQARFSRSRQDLLDAIERIEPTDGRTLLEEPLEFGRAYTTIDDPELGPVTQESATIELFSDGDIADLAEQVLRGEALRYHRVGAPDTDNVAVGAISAERPYDRPSAVQVFASLVNHGDEARQCDLELAVDGVVRAVQTLDLPAASRDAATGARLPGRNQLVFTPFELGRGAVIEVRHLCADALAVDDRAIVVVAPPKRLRVALVARRSFLLESALEGLALESLTLVDAPTFERMIADGGTELEAYDVIVLDNYAPEVPLPPGRYLAFGKAPRVDGLSPYGAGEAQLVLNVRDQHPVMRFVNMDQLFIAKTVLVEPASDVRVLAAGSTSALVTAVERAGMHLVYVAFDPLDSDWPFNRSFVTFLFNAVDYLGHVGSGLTTEGLRPGQAITARLPRGATDVFITAPDGAEHALETGDDGHVSWGPIRHAGAYDLRWTPSGADAPAHRAYGVNLLDDDESAIAAREAIDVGNVEAQGQVGGEVGATALWPWALGACLAVLVAEWWVYHRKLV